MITFFIFYTAACSVVFGLAGARLGWVLAIRYELRHRIKYLIVRRCDPPPVHPRIIARQEMARWRERNN